MNFEGKIVEKGQNYVKKSENSYCKIHFIVFLLLNILNQIVKIFHNCGNSGHTSDNTDFVRGDIHLSFIRVSTKAY